MFLFTDSQSDAELSATEADALDLTSVDKEKAEYTAVTVNEQVSSNKQAETLTLDQENAKEEEEEEEEGEQEEDDAVSNKSLDLNFASKLMDFKLSTGDQAASNSCDVCGKSFKFPATLGRHKKAHLCDSKDQEKGSECPDFSPQTCIPENQDVTDEDGDQEEELPVDLKVARSPVENEQTAAKKEEDEGMLEEKMERPMDKSDDDKDSKPEAKGTKADKRKKICTVCSKRFWSLQDLTRHMRSHTG